jgi:hypothetical protein
MASGARCATSVVTFGLGEHATRKKMVQVPSRRRAPVTTTRRASDDYARASIKRQGQIAPGDGAVSVHDEAEEWRRNAGTLRWRGECVAWMAMPRALSERTATTSVRRE